jgi:hypothetical protein
MYNALTPSDFKVMQFIRALLALSIHHQHQAKSNTPYNDGTEFSFKANVSHSLLFCFTDLRGDIKINEDLNCS